MFQRKKKFCINFTVICLSYPNQTIFNKQFHTKFNCAARNYDINRIRALLTDFCEIWTFKCVAQIGKSQKYVDNA